MTYTLQLSESGKFGMHNVYQDNNWKSMLLTSIPSLI